ncbi:hypothetical protein [Lentzea cavernae]|uniref:Uncharacterized protein n=1 Tax=Lentzea cavernae TaxID=2020703 RepID=A0ABQ3MQG5_9PSEU|nr:hypothetical protein [Lentzea cavernae]GHH57792.1 hypothetical protein GCM10017774_78080 [Lentzea cavernae]
MTDFRARLQQAWTEDHGHPPTWVEELLLDHYAEAMDAAMDRYFGNVVDWKPLGILGVDVSPWLADELDLQGVSPVRMALASARPTSTPPPALRRPSSSVPPNRSAIEDDRITRELVPLVRAAAAEARLPGSMDVLGGHLRTSRTVDQAEHRHAWERWSAEELQRDRDAFGDALDRAVTACLNLPDPDPLPPSDNLFETVMAAYNKMLGPSRPPRRTEPFKLTREQIDQIPKVDTDERPFTPTAFLLDGIPVVEVLTVEESTPHAEGWALTFEQAFRGVTQLDHRGTLRRDPLYLTQQQIERMSRVLWFTLPDNWDQLLEQGGEIFQMVSRPVHLVHHPDSSTPCLERWMDL